MSRILTAAIALPILIASILISWLQPLFVAIAAAAMLFGLYEFYVLARKKDIKPDVAAGFLGGAALFTIFYFATPAPNWPRLDHQIMTLILIVFTVGTLIAAIFRRRPFTTMIVASVATSPLMLYV